MIGGGRTWARWLFGAVYAIAAVSFLIALLRAPGVFFSAPIVLQLAVLAHFALQGAALVLVFAPSSREWFRSSGRAKKEVPAGKTYRIYAHPARTAPIAVKVGFCWPAFVVGPLWFLLNRMFVNFLIVTAFVVGAHLFFSYSVRGAWQGAMALLYYATALCIGLIGNPLLAAELLGDGYVLRSTVRASSFSKATDLALREEQPDGVPAS